MDKIKEFLDSYPAIKIFGVFGIIVLLVVFVVGTIFSAEVERFWNEIAHPVETETLISQEDENNGSEGVQPSIVPTDDVNDSGEDDVDLPDTPTDAPYESEEPEKVTSFDGKILNGVLVGEDVRKEVFVPQQTGIYRFDFDIDSVKKDYVFYIVDSVQKELNRNYYSSSDPAGISVTLEEGQEYTLVVESQETEEYEEVEYTININSPDEIVNIEGDKIKGQIRYIDQEIEYRYMPPKTGIYRFDFDINNVKLSYGFNIYDEKEEELVNTVYDNKGVTCELAEGKQYKVLVTQREGIPQYTISIGVPDEAKNVKGNAIKGSIRYIDQVNRYYFTVTKTGTYKFKLGIDDVNESYRFILLSKKKEELTNTLSNSNETIVELKKGEKYEILIGEYSGSVKYNVKISSKFN